MTESLRGEFSHSSFASMKEIDLVSAVSNTLKLSSPEDQEHLKKILFPAMSMDAVIKENINKLIHLKNWVFFFVIFLHTTVCIFYKNNNNYYNSNV